MERKDTKETPQDNSGALIEKKEEAREKRFEKKSKELFNLHPLAKSLYFTSDGYAFFEQADASNHARTLKEKEVLTINK